MKLIPIGEHIIVKGIKAERISASGIVIPDTVDKERSEKGEVIAVGPGKMLDNGSVSGMSVSVGQTVLFKKYAPDEVKIEGEEFLVISMNDVIAIIE